MSERETFYESDKALVADKSIRALLSAPTEARSASEAHKEGRE